MFSLVGGYCAEVQRMQYLPAKLYVTYQKVVILINVCVCL